MCLPTTGTLPQKENEVAMSTITLDMLGIPHEIGSRVCLEFTLNGQKQEKEFSLSGYWKGDPLFLSQEIWISKEFCLTHCKEALKENIEKQDFEGDYNLSLWISNPYRSEKIAEIIDQTYKISDSQARISPNPAYQLFGEDGFPFQEVLALLIIVFFAGYLIIFNVFYLSVQNDIQTYGLLKTVGTTGKQLKKIVKKQAMQLSAIGIPIGLLLGYLAGRIMTPYLLEGEMKQGAVRVFISANPIVFIIAAVFSYITVYIGCMVPCHSIAKISPIEAVRMSEGEKKKQKKGRNRITPWNMALENSRRMWKKLLLVIISLALPIMILNTVYCIADGFDYDEYVSTYISGDFQLSGCANNLLTSNLHAVSPDVQNKLEQNKNIKNISYVYDTEVKQTLDDTGYKNLKEIIDKAEKEKVIKGSWLKQERSMLESRQIISHLLGINKAAFSKMKFWNKTCSWEEFQTGAYVVVGAQNEGLGNYYNIGDKVKLSYGNEEEKEYTVIGIANMPYDMNYPFGAGTYFDYSFYLPEKEYIEQSKNTNAMQVTFDTQKGTDKEVNRWLLSYIDKTEKSLYINSKLAIEKECQGFANKYYLILGILCAILLIIGVLNFFNTSAVSINARKKELAMLESIGMTKGQMKKMLIYEGILYLVFAVALADTAGVLISNDIVQRTVGKAFFFECHSTILPSIITLPLWMAIMIWIPCYHFKKVSKKSLVDRIRE